MEREILKIQDVTVMRARGIIRTTEYLTDRDEFVTWLEDGWRKFVFNLTELSHIGSSSLGVLLQCLKIAEQNDAQLRLVVTGDQLELLRLTKLDDIFEAYTDEQQAMTAF